MEDLKIVSDHRKHSFTKEGFDKFIEICKAYHALDPVAKEKVGKKGRLGYSHRKHDESDEDENSDEESDEDD